MASVWLHEMEGDVMDQSPEVQDRYMHPTRYKPKQPFGHNIMEKFPFKDGLRWMYLISQNSRELNQY